MEDTMFWFQWLNFIWIILCSKKWSEFPYYFIFNCQPSHKDAFLEILLLLAENDSSIPIWLWICSMVILTAPIKLLQNSLLAEAEAIATSSKTAFVLIVATSRSTFLTSSSRDSWSTDSPASTSLSKPFKEFNNKTLFLSMSCFMIGSQRRGENNQMGSSTQGLWSGLFRIFAVWILGSNTFYLWMLISRSMKD